MRPWLASFDQLEIHVPSPNASARESNEGISARSTLPFPLEPRGNLVMSFLVASFCRHLCTDIYSSSISASSSLMGWVSRRPPGGAARSCKEHTEECAGGNTLVAVGNTEDLSIWAFCIYRGRNSNSSECAHMQVEATVQKVSHRWEARALLLSFTFSKTSSFL